MCKKSFLFFVLLVFCLLVARPAEITESELAQLETLQRTQLTALVTSKELLAQSAAQLTQSQARYTEARRKLTAAESLAKLQQQQIETLHAESMTLSAQVKKSATSFGAYVSEAEQKQAVMSEKISARNKIIAVLSGVICAYLAFKIVKFGVFKRF